MNRLLRLFSTSVGRKLLMAVTGVVLIGFLIGHMLGNMALFQGRESINAYAAWLQGHPFLWVLRGGLLVVFLVHVAIGIQLARENSRARSVRYAGARAYETSGVSRYMLVTGLLVIVFVGLHLAHFTFGAIAHDAYVRHDATGRHDVYAMVVQSFRNPLLSGAYIVAMILVGIHLSHAARSFFQTVGLNHSSYNAVIRIFGHVLVAVFVIGNCSIPLLVLSGVVGLEGR